MFTIILYYQIWSKFRVQTNQVFIVFSIGKDDDKTNSTLYSNVILKVLVDYFIRFEVLDADKLFCPKWGG